MEKWHKRLCPLHRVRMSRCQTFTSVSLHTDPLLLALNLYYIHMTLGGGILTHFIHIIHAGVTLHLQVLVWNSYQRATEWFLQPWQPGEQCSLCLKPQATSSLNPRLTQWELIHGTNLVFITREPGYLNGKTDQSPSWIRVQDIWFKLAHPHSCDVSTSKIFKAWLPANMMAEQLSFRTGCALLFWKVLMKNTDMQLSLFSFKLKWYWRTGGGGALECQLEVIKSLQCIASISVLSMKNISRKNKSGRASLNATRNVALCSF